MDRPTWAPQGIDLTRASAARMYDFFLGGSHNFEVDREAGRRALEILPDLPKIMQANRAFIRDAVRHAAASGVTQFLDIGSGIPTFGNVHEIALEASPDSRVVYVDHDPVAVAHSQALLADVPQADVVEADLLRPKEILSRVQEGGLLDLDRPVALLLVAVLHFVEESADPYALVAELRDALAPGSVLVLSHASQDTRPEESARIEELYARAGTPFVMRTRPQVERFFEGFTPDPGVMLIAEWGDNAQAAGDDPGRFSGYVGVGRKP
ncbi:SAM-dependent methyltransferase [Streptacidiphilus sp. ASG 303]|uniref:SAM-dependent methyltransferase n=1 Tax=Streptacidiphilus sp. ASG 303 TaxID=2896847 RepID=UPI001E4E6119|nr:SAM-dependent methyltransferase [Streptacidiphilus sp. ASG 303]MCD0482548.1 SAM-dependent methyltransferase [Streptacidiphilus sp. ASG 303]